jgi:hypothetical protein
MLAEVDFSDGTARHRQRTERRRWRGLVAVAVAMLLLAAAAWLGTHRWRALAEEPQVELGWSAWALLDLHTQEIRGSTDSTSTNTAESMLKAWIAADDLRQLSERNIQPHADEIAALAAMIQDSDDPAAETIYRRNGEDQVILRLISICGLTETTVRPKWWSLTQISPRDATRMGACIADGRAAGPKWTKWVLDQMRQVRGEGYFGIVSAVPAAEQPRLAIKNGWTLHVNEGSWAVNCLAISADWVLAVQSRYPTSVGDLRHGADTCAEVARSVLPSTDEQPLAAPARESGPDSTHGTGGAG